MTGIESSAWAKEKYPNKKIGICQRGKLLLPAINGAHQLVNNILTKLDIKVHLETPYG